MTDQDADREEVFVVRFWPDRTTARADAWRGCVDHLLTSQRQFFVELPALDEFIRACLHDASRNSAARKLKEDITS